MIKVCKLVATMVLMVATLSSCMNSSKLGLEDSWTVGQPHTKNLEIKQRFDEIHNFAPKGKHVDLVLKNLFLTCSIQPEGENPILERKEEYSDYDRHPEFRRINERMAQLAGTPVSPTGEGRSFFSDEIKGPKKIVNSIAFAMHAVRTNASKGKPKFYVMEIVMVGYGQGHLLGKPSYHVHFDQVDRSDFINSQDVDWMLGVDDFTKLDLNKSDR